MAPYLAPQVASGDLGNGLTEPSGLVSEWAVQDLNL
jgi:hypothetical protein